MENSHIEDIELLVTNSEAGIRDSCFAYSAENMFELQDGKLYEIEKKQLTVCDYKKWIDDKYTDSSAGLNIIIDSYRDRCFVVSEDEYTNGYVPEDYYNDDNIEEETKSDEDVCFIFAITYKCNMRCTYCYQQHDPNLKRELISEDNLEYALGVIDKYMEKNPEKNVSFGVFGGEPLLPENEKVIDRLIDYCKEKKTTIHIITNGTFLESYLKKIIINRKFISSVNPTIDSDVLNYYTRRDLDNSRNNSYQLENLIKCIKTLLNYKVYVNVATNIDKDNYKNVWRMKRKFDELELLQSKYFIWSLGRVDDRLYETGYPKILMESEVLKEVIKHELPENMRAAFLKTTYNLVKKLGIEVNQKEKKGRYNYCWNSSTEDEAYYIDNELKTYRCTYTVGRPLYSIFDFSYENLDNYRIRNVTAESYNECKGCKIGGYCGGGCQLSHSRDFERCCEYEKDTFAYFMEEIFIPSLKEIYVRDAGEERGNDRYA